MTYHASFNTYANYNAANARLDEFLDNKSGLSANLTFSRGNNAVDYIVIFKDEQSKSEPMFTVGELEQMSIDELKDICSMLLIDDYDETKEDLVASLKDISKEVYYLSLYEDTDHWQDLPTSFTLYDFYQGNHIKVMLDDGAYKWDKRTLQDLIFEAPIALRLEISNDAGEFLDSTDALEDAYFDLGGDEYELDREVLMQAINKLYKDKLYHQLVIDACN